MQAEQYLGQAYRLNELIHSNQEELAALHMMKDNLKSTDNSQERVQSTPSGEAGYEDIVRQIVELENAIIRDIEKMLSLKIEIRAVIDAVENNDEKLLLQYRYLNCYSWGIISKKMNYSKRTVHRIHRSALANVKIPE